MIMSTVLTIIMPKGTRENHVFQEEGRLPPTCTDSTPFAVVEVDWSGPDNAR